MRKEGFFYFTTPVTVLGSIQPPVQWLLGTLLPGLKQSGHEANDSPPSSAKLKNGAAIPPPPQDIPMVWCLID
jgi:hypothetical protein